MIKINLLNSKVKSQLDPAMTTIAVTSDLVLTKDELNKQALLRILIIIIFPAGFYVFDNFYYQDNMKLQFPPLEKRIQELSQFNNAKEKFVKDIKQFESEGKLIQGKIDKIKVLTELRGKEIEIHRFFQTILPQKMWFDEFLYDWTKGEIRIKGMAYNATDIQKLRTDIRKYILFNSCEIITQRQVDFDQQKVENFEMLVTLGKDQ